MRRGSVFLAVFLLWDLCSAQPFPYLKLIESVSWDSSFITQFTPEQEKEIRKICEQLKPNEKENVIYSPNKKYRLEIRETIPTDKEGNVYHVAYIDSTGIELWEDTLDQIPEISKTGEWMYLSDNEGCGMIFVARATPLFQITKVIDECFDQKQISPDGQYIAAATSANSDELVIFSAEGEELWRRELKTGGKMVAVSEDSRYVVAASCKIEGELKGYYTALAFYTRDGKSLGGCLVTYEQLHFHYPPVLRALHLSPDGKLTFAIFSGAIAAFETKTGKRKWIYYFPDVYWEVSELIFIPGTDLVIISVYDSARGRKQRHLDLLDLQRRTHNNNFITVEDPSIFNMRLKAVPSETKMNQIYIVGADYFQKHLMQLFIPQ